MEPEAHEISSRVILDSSTDIKETNEFSSKNQDFSRIFVNNFSKQSVIENDDPALFIIDSVKNVTTLLRNEKTCYPEIESVKAAYINQLRNIESCDKENIIVYRPGALNNSFSDLHISKYTIVNDREVHKVLKHSDVNLSLLPIPEKSVNGTQKNVETNEYTTPEIKANDEVKEHCHAKKVQSPEQWQKTSSESKSLISIEEISARFENHNSEKTCDCCTILSPEESTISDTKKLVHINLKPSIENIEPGEITMTRYYTNSINIELNEELLSGKTGNDLLIAIEEQCNQRLSTQEFVLNSSDETVIPVVFSDSQSSASPSPEKRNRTKSLDSGLKPPRKKYSNEESKGWSSYSTTTATQNEQKSSLGKRARIKRTRSENSMLLINTDLNEELLSGKTGNDLLIAIEEQCNQRLSTQEFVLNSSDETVMPVVFSDSQGSASPSPEKRHRSKSQIAKKSKRKHEHDSSLDSISKYGKRSRRKTRRRSVSKSRSKHEPEKKRQKSRQHQ